MPRSYTCPQCRQSYSTTEFLAHGGLCPACHKILAITDLSGEASAPGQTPAGERGTTIDPSPIPQSPLNSRHDNGNSKQAGGPDEVVALCIIPVKGRQTEVPAITQLLNALAPVQPLCLEISGTNLHRYLIVRCQRKNVPTVRGQITGIYGSVEIQELPESEDPAGLFRSPGKAVKTMRLGLARPAGLPLRTYRELLENDTLLPILGALYGIGDGEASIAQILIHGPAPESWAAATKRELLVLKRRQAGTVPPGELLRWILIVLGAGPVSLYFLLGQWVAHLWMLLFGAGLMGAGMRFFSGSGIRWSESLEENVTRKIQQTGYQVEIRLAAAADSEARSQELLARLAGAYQVFGFEAGNQLTRLAAQALFDPSDLSSHHPGVMILGDEEIATLWHLPVGELPDMLHAARVEDTLRVWDLETGREERVLEGHTREVKAVAMTPDGRRVVSGSGDDTLRVWDLETGRELACFIGESWIRAIALTPDCRGAFVGDDLGNVYYLRYVEPHVP